MPYDPLHLYDVPDVLAAQIVDGETTWRGLKNLFLSPDRLSPNERDSLSDKLAGENASRATKTVTGILTNRSEFPWRDIEFECRFYDAAGQLIDAASPRSFLTIRTNDDAAFRVTVNPAAPTNAYDHFTLTVTHARNLRAAF